MTSVPFRFEAESGGPYLGLSTTTEEMVGDIIHQGRAIYREVGSLGVVALCCAAVVLFGAVRGKLQTWAWVPIVAGTIYYIAYRLIRPR